MEHFENDYPHAGSLPDRLRFLVRYAVLAPSSHNTQPWRFHIAADRIDLFLDESRWLKVADADQRELHISLGCALENLLVAAEHFGLGPQTEYPSGSVRCESSKNGGWHFIHADAGLNHPMLHIVWERPRNGDLRVRIRPDKNCGMPVESAKEFIDAVFERLRLNKTTSDHMSDMLTYDDKTTS